MNVKGIGTSIVMTNLQQRKQFFMVLYLKVIFQNRKEHEIFSSYSMSYAAKLNLQSYSRYEKENFAYVEIKGKEEQLDRFVDWCRKRPQCSIVDELTVKADKTLRSERI